MYIMGKTSETYVVNKECVSEEKGSVALKKEIGLLEGVSIILGAIFGSGIFISPKGVIQEVGSVGFSLVVWVLSGLFAAFGALCYAELGTTIPKSGGEYVYIREAFGPLLSFLYLWDVNFIFIPTTNAIMGLTFANYITQPFFPNCQLPDTATRIIAALAICFLTYINSYDVKITTKMQDVFMFGKVFALVIIIVAGLTYLFIGENTHFDGLFDGTNTNPGNVAVAFYSGIFSYGGWSCLNVMTEELKDPYKNLPRAIYISLPLVTMIYVLANVAYLAVLTPTEMISSNAIAVTFGEKVLGAMSWMMPLFVALSAFGGLSVHIMISSRLCFVGAREGQMPSILSFINLENLTPLPSLVFLNMLSLIMLCTSDVYFLITYSGFVASFFIALSVGGMIWMRSKKPDLERPIKVSIVFPCVFVLVCIFLILLPCYVRPYEVIMGILITLSGVPAYFFGITWVNKPTWFENFLVKVTNWVQKLFLAVKEDK